MKSRTIASIATSLVLALTLAACGSGTFGTNVTEDGIIEITAENATNTTATTAGSLSIGQNECIVINPVLEKGSIHVTISDGTGKTKVYDGDVSGKVFFTVDAEPGVYDVVASPSDADGYVTILAGDPAALQEADAKLAELAESGQLPDEVSSTVAEVAAEGSSAQSK